MTLQPGYLPPAHLGAELTLGVLKLFLGLLGGTQAEIARAWGPQTPSVIT